MPIKKDELRDVRTDVGVVFVLSFLKMHQFIQNIHKLAHSMRCSLSLVSLF